MAKASTPSRPKPSPEVLAPNNILPDPDPYLKPERNHKGQFTYSTGEVYEGGFDEGEMHGYGKYWNLRGGGYMGNWRFGERPWDKAAGLQDFTKKAQK